MRERGFTDFRAKLRRDGDEAILLQVIQRVVGASVMLLTDLWWSGVMHTTRITTDVVSITEIGDKA